MRFNIYLRKAGFRLPLPVYSSEIWISPHGNMVISKPGVWKT